jgi:hypothetical protein
MKRESSYVLILAILLSLIIAIPADICGSPQAAGQRAGEVSRLIPAVSIARGSKTINASAKSVVEWQDLLNTKADARARIALDDGSVLNVGSDSSIKVVKHDAGAQQTDLELPYESSARKRKRLQNPTENLKFTPRRRSRRGWNGLYVGYENNVMNVIATKGRASAIWREVRVASSGPGDQPAQRRQFRSMRSNASSARYAVTAARDTEVGPRPGIGLEKMRAPRQGNGLYDGHLALVPVVIFLRHRNTTHSALPLPS